MQFTKLFNSILDSTIWQEPLETKVVWITMLAMVDRNGEVHASIPGLAKRAGVTMEQCKDALACLQAPDEFSRTKDHEGRRIKEVDGGWELLNHGKYRTLLSAEERREYNRRKQAEYRNVKKLSNNVKQCQSKSAQCTHTDAESDTDTDAKVNTVPPNPQGGSADAPVREIEKPRVQPSKRSDDEEWLNEIATNPAYTGINVRQELGKMQAWCSVNRKQPSRQRFINWLNRAERPIAALSKNQAYDAKSATAGKTREQVLNF